MLDNHEVTFNVNTVAEVSLISEKMIKYLKLDPTRLRKPTKILSGVSRKPLDVVSELIVHFAFKGRSSKQTVYVTRKVKNNLLGLPANKALNLVAQVNSVEENIQEKYQSLLTGLGTFQSDYKIQLNPDAQHLHCLHHETSHCLCERRFVKS